MRRRALAMIVLSSLVTSRAPGGDGTTSTRVAGSGAPERVDVGGYGSRERPGLTILDVVAAVRDGRGLGGCAAMFGVRRVTCLSG